MVCLQQEGVLKVTVEDAPQPQPEPVKIRFTADKTNEDIIKEISEKYTYLVNDFQVVFRADGEEIDLGKHREKKFFDTIWEGGLFSIDCELVIRQIKKDKNMPLYVSDVTPEDDLLLGASASPTTSCEVVSSVEFDYKDYRAYRERRGGIKLERDEEETTSDTEARGSNTNKRTNYIGLVNQAMTCYLNSLLQALYMTPEFRNALYNWEFDGVNETRSIPYQLQKLFLNLQTSSKTAVETTDLTISFGWQGSDAWHQHDIQELCRVMFDALEQKFKDTKQANLINDLYEGKMLDYVKCLECRTEKSREDTFLDIPLPVRPFGSTVAYNSVEEALRAFVQPETLDENNQYFCEKCNKKCDAHKGLKFTKFPYLLTLHLKRFDFDYNTMHRIKLNDKVVFSEKLNLNSFIPSTKVEADQITIEEREATNVKCDDCSTTDSGSADDESCQGTDISSAVNGPDDNCADSDEGIDVSSGINHENDAKGPYTYELFSIMIHSGSASGGHYYAYIKDFDKNLWYCFNDQSVSPITEDDIQKTYGGGPQRGYYSGVYSSSTNAYMLMYRQIDKERNTRAMTVNEFPPHIKQLLLHTRQKEEEDRLLREKEDEMLKIKVECVHPTTGNVMDVNISTYNDSTLAELAQHARSRFKLDGLVGLNDCRIVTFNKQFNCIDRSFDDDDAKLGDFNLLLDIFHLVWFLEVKEPGTQWRQYKKGGINIKVYPIEFETEEIKEPKLYVRLDNGETLGELKQDLSKLLETDPANLKVIFDKAKHTLCCLKEDDEIITFENARFKYVEDLKFFVTSFTDSEKKWKQFVKMAAMYRHVTYVSVVAPDTDESTLELLSIPSIDQNHNQQQEVPPDRHEANSPNLRVSPQPSASEMCGDGYDQSQSNSEDSSLSDSDRTLIGDAPDCRVILSRNSPSPADQHMSSPMDPCQDGTYNYDVMGKPSEDMIWDYTDPCNCTHCSKTNAHSSSGCSGCIEPQSDFFKVISCIPYNKLSDIGTRCFQIIVDKRMHLVTFKKKLESVLRVPSEYFKVLTHQRGMNDYESFGNCLKLIKDEHTLCIKLEKILTEGEYKCKIYHMKADLMQPSSFLFEHYFSKGQTVGNLKNQVLKQAKKKYGLDIPYNRCRLREKGYLRDPKPVPSDVLLDDQRFCYEVVLILPREFYLQELTEPETVTSHNQTVVFVRQWHPSNLTLDPFQEIVLDRLKLPHIKSRISSLSKIPKDRIQVAQIKHDFPCDMHLLEIHEELEWDTMYDTMERSLRNGSVFFYRDQEEEPKVLTPEERKDIKQKEDARLCRAPIKTYSPSREKALKIYLDTSPSKSDDSVD